MTADYIIHHWYVDFSSGTLLHQLSGEERRLGEYQLKLLLVLAENAGKTLSRDELTALVWERRVIGLNSLPNAIHALRAALEDDGKQQRIIKTVPRKGYILEAEYCQRVSSTNAYELAKIPALDGDAPLTSEDGVEASEPESAPPSESLAVSAPDTTPFQPPTRRFWYWLVPAQSVLLLGFIIWLFVLPMLAPVTKVTERDAGVYSNIRLLELNRQHEQNFACEDLHNQLRTAFYPLNQLLKNQQVKMDAIFFGSCTSLNYTLTLKNSCDHTQLAMNILNWRTNAALLTALIYRETERKLNEMENCVN
ncbi:transcriptional regulator [Erwinia sp. AnSW2-5]|uniref:transcriptional regulator n=1 Tax=Erwinia sp. AnSW2-5 TaxID=3367692 RepID=UPI00385E8CE9